MHPDPSDSGGAGLAGAPGERRPEPRGDAAAPGAPGGGSRWVAAAALAAVCASCLLAGWWPAAAGGAGPGTVLLRLSLYLGCAAAAFLLGTVFSLVCRSPRAPPPDFAAAWRRLAARHRPESPVYGNSNESVQSRRVVISHNMDKALKEVFDYSYRDYILSWYGNLSRDEGQLYHLLSEDFWEVARQLRHRLSHVDMVKVVCNDVVRALLTHFCDLKAASGRHEEQPRPFVLHSCLRNSNDEVRFLQTCSRVLVLCLLPSKNVQSLSLRIMLAEILTTKGLHRWSIGKNLPANARSARDGGSVSKSGRSPGVGNGIPLQCSCPENSMDRRAWRATVHGVAKSQTRLSTAPPPTYVTQST